MIIFLLSFLQYTTWSHIHALKYSNLIYAELVQTPQDTIYFRNPSFEGNPGASIIPDQWLSQTKGSTPDLLPGAWNLQPAPLEGNTCLGLVVREDNTSEDLSQVLSKPLKSNECYEFYAWLSTLPKYVGYNQPCQLRIYGGTTGNKEELLAQSPLISSNQWNRYKFQFTTKKEIKSITLVAWYGPGVMFKYKGNILVDNLSPIVRCDRA